MDTHNISKSCPNSNTSNTFLNQPEFMVADDNIFNCSRSQTINIPWNYQGAVKIKRSKPIDIPGAKSTIDTCLDIECRPYRKLKPPDAQI